MIRIDAIRELHHDLHMRPFEAERRVYLLLDAHLLNADAADALLKDLEEPPLVRDDRARRRRARAASRETIRSRCQLVPFRRLSERAVLRWLAEHAPERRRGRGTARRARRRRAPRPRRAGCSIPQRGSGGRR